jgi:TfoX/Sxy family transcriptional regulator of competence genes
MPYDEELAARVRQVLRRRTDITERKMFGGLAFLRHGKMCCGIVGQDLMVRVVEKDRPLVLRRAHVRPMDFTGRPLRGFVYVWPRGLATEGSLREWIRKGLAFVMQRGAAGQSQRTTRTQS